MAEEAPSDPQRDRFTVLGVVASACRFVFQNRRAFLALAILPMILYMLVYVPQLAPTSDETMIGAVWTIFAMLVMLVSSSVFAVSWNRFFLFRRRDTQTPVQFRLGRRELRYLFYSVLVTVPAIVILVVLLLPIWLNWEIFSGAAIATEGTNGDSLDDDVPTIVAIAVASGTALISYYAIYARLAFIFPDISVDSFRGLRTSWRQTRGVVGRLFRALILVNIPYLLLEASDLLPELSELTLGLEIDLDAQAVHAGDWLFWIPWTILNIFVDFLTVAVAVSVICLVFRQRTGWVPPSAPLAEGP